MSAKLDAPFTDWRVRVETALSERLDEPDIAFASRLHAAMRHAVLSGGKRLRPLLVLAASSDLGGSLERAMPAACAVEFVHAYSLVHDDLPAMDDDAMRHGVDSCHVAFDEATAILAGDALQALAFDTLATADANPDVPIAMIRCLAGAISAGGMVGGQMLDMQAEGQHLALADLQRIHAAKTGALFRASVALGGHAAMADTSQLDLLARFGDTLGLAFQIVDDILDVTAPTSALGKPAGSDAVSEKSTYPALLGLDESRRLASGCHAEAAQLLADLGIADGALATLATFAVARAS